MLTNMLHTAQSPVQGRGGWGNWKQSINQSAAEWDQYFCLTWFFCSHWRKWPTESGSIRFWTMRFLPSWTSTWSRWKQTVPRLSTCAASSPPSTSPWPPPAEGKCWQDPSLFIWNGGGERLDHKEGLEEKTGRAQIWQQLRPGCTEYKGCISLEGPVWMHVLL